MTNTDEPQKPIPQVREGTYYKWRANSHDDYAYVLCGDGSEARGIAVALRELIQDDSGAIQSTLYLTSHTDTSHSYNLDLKLEPYLDGGFWLFKGDIFQNGVDIGDITRMEYFGEATSQNMALRLTVSDNERCDASDTFSIDEVFDFSGD